LASKKNLKQTKGQLVCGITQVCYWLNQS